MAHFLFKVLDNEEISWEGYKIKDSKQIVEPIYFTSFADPFLEKGIPLDEILDLYIEDKKTWFEPQEEVVVAKTSYYSPNEAANVISF